LHITRFSQLEFNYKILTLIFPDKTEHLSIKGEESIGLKEFKEIVSKKYDMEFFSVLFEEKQLL